jgi:hypothetical protein
MVPRLLPDRPSAQIVGQRLDPLGPAGVGGAEHVVVAAQAPDLVQDHAPRVEVHRPHLAREIVRDAFAVQIHEHDPVAQTGWRDGGVQPGAGLRHHNLAAPHPPLHGLVAEERNDQGHRARTLTHSRARQVVKGQGVGVGDRAAENHHVAVHTLGEDAQVALAVREAALLELSGLARRRLAQRPLQITVAPGRKYDHWCQHEDILTRIAPQRPRAAETAAPPWQRRI